MTVDALRTCCRELACTKFQPTNLTAHIR